MIPADDPRNTGYVGRFPLEVEVAGRQVQVSAHLAMVRGRMTCVGIDVRSFEAPPAIEDNRDDFRPLGDEWVEINSPVVRAVRVAEVIEQAFDRSRGLFRQALDGLTIADDVITDVFEPTPSKRRGPKPALSDDVLRTVVAPAYLMAVKKPVVAVRAALDRSGLLPGAGPDGRVTPDQARKAVVTARARGFIPPAKRPGK